jgi:hypothetical protein
VPTVRNADYIGSWIKKWRARHFLINHQQVIMRRTARSHW